jgi:ketosteroid isomerase-like protein
MDPEQLIDAYDEAWNAHDVETICSMHTHDIVFENHSAGERAEGDAVAAHIEEIFRNWPDLRFRGRRRYVGSDFVVSEWTASATRDGKPIEWDGIDVFPLEGGKIKRKDVYSAYGAARELS